MPSTQYTINKQPTTVFSCYPNGKQQFRQDGFDVSSLTKYISAKPESHSGFRDWQFQRTGYAFENSKLDNRKYHRYSNNRRFVGPQKKWRNIFQKYSAYSNVMDFEKCVRNADIYSCNFLSNPQNNYFCYQKTPPLPISDDSDSFSPSSHSDIDEISSESSFSKQQNDNKPQNRWVAKNTFLQKPQQQQHNDLNDNENQQYQQQQTGKQHLKSSDQELEQIQLKSLLEIKEDQIETGDLPTLENEKMDEPNLNDTKEDINIENDKIVEINTLLEDDKEEALQNTSNEGYLIGTDLVVSEETAPPPRGFSTSFLTWLGQEIHDWENWTKLDNEEQVLRDSLFEEIKLMITGLWPGVNVILYGSSACGLALPNSDIDCVVEGLPFFDQMQSYYFDQLTELLRQIGASYIATIPSARVPLIKFLHPKMIFFDISFKVNNAQKSVELVKNYIHDFPNARPIIMVVKALLKQQSLNCPRFGGLGSYALVLILVAYLQLLKTWQPNIGTDSYSLGWLLVQFLSYLATHDLQCAFTPGSSEPVDSKSLSRFRQRLDVRDPLDSGNNVAFSCKNFFTIQVLFNMCVEELQKAGSKKYNKGLLSTFLDIRQFQKERPSLELRPKYTVRKFTQIM